MVENTATDPALLAAMSVDPDDYGGETRPSADAADAAQTEPGADAGTEEGTGLGDLTSEELVADIQRNISCIAFCHARVIALIDEVERRGLWAQWVGVTSLPQWVMHIAAVSAHTAREYVRVMMALREMPKVRESLGEGNVSFSKVREVTRLVGRIPDEEAMRLADVSTGSQIGVIARNYLQLSAANGDGEAPCALPSDSVSMRTTEPGRTRITIDLGEDEAAEFSSMLDAARHVIEQQVDTDDSDSDEQEKPPYEPISQVMCLMEIVHAFPRAESPGTVDVDRARMLVHASAEVVTRFGAPDEALESVPAGTSADRKKDLTCRIDGFGGITSATAERLSCEALISGTIKDADGDVLMLGRSKRLVSRRQRLALSARDMGCQFPGCRARRRCDAHHIRPWSQGGATDLDNLILLCRTHHTAVHKYELNISRTSAAFAGALGGQAAFAFFLPDGSQLLPLEAGKRGRLVFDTARLVKVAEEAVAEADPSTVGGGYGFSLDYCIAWMFEAEWRHARANNVAA